MTSSMVSLSLVLTLFLANADDQRDTQFKNSRQDGQIFSIRIVRGQPLRIFVLGREEAKVNLSDLKLTVKRLKPYPSQTLTLAKDGESFIVKGAQEANGEKIEVKAKSMLGEETFYFELEEIN